MLPPTDSMLVPRFCNLPSFMRLPVAPAAEGLDAAILGLPSDAGAPFRTGARFGPNAVRAASVMLRPINPYRGGINVFSALRVQDVGDAPVVPGYLEQSFAQIEAFAALVVQTGAVPFAIGGDHSVSLPQMRAVAARHGPLALVHFDSHTDTWDTYFGERRDSAGTPFRRAAEQGLVDPGRSIQIGMRGSLFGADDVSQSLDLGYSVLGTDEVMEMGPEALARAIALRVGRHPVYLSFDMDFVDPAAAPGVQTPEAGGPDAWHTLRILRALRGLRLVGCDVVETNPLYDGPGQITALLAATVIAELLAMLAAERR
jgi:agmatinase